MVVGAINVNVNKVATADACARNLTLIACGCRLVWGLGLEMGLSVRPFTGVGSEVRGVGHVSWGPELSISSSSWVRWLKLEEGDD